MQDNNGQTPLHFAAKFGHQQIVANIITWCKQTINISDKQHVTPFVQAVVSGHFDIVNEIIGLHKEKVISLTSDDHGRCFMAAAFHGETKLLNLLKESFCTSSENDIGKKWLATTTAKGRTALHAAVIRDDTACLNTVLALINSVFGSFNEELVRVDDSGMNALHIAVSKQAKNVVKDLLDIDQHQHVLAVGESKFGNSPLQLAILSSNEELSKQIAQRWTADEINHRNFKGETALHMATIKGMNVISTLLDLGGDAFAFDDRGRLPLFSHCNTNGGLSALYDLFEHMMKKENSRKIRDLLSEEDMDHDSSATVRYVTNLTVDGSYNFDPDRTGSYNSTSNGRLSYGQSSLTSYRRSLSSSLNSRRRPSSSLSHKPMEKDSDGRLSNQFVNLGDEVFDELESY
jgi:ankyrin repeat protein